ncbi:hypothetical protein MPSEU_000468500 [Mayamaea pseudoterrestris]|nr:hypothetical protein MPSEU_000468500 [Mayamaea pseudoterrestris]
MSTTTVLINREKRLEGVQVTKGIKQCLNEAQVMVKGSGSEHSAYSTAKQVTRSLHAPMTLQEARTLILKYHESDELIPIPVIRAMTLVVGKEKIEAALSNGSDATQLAFTPPALATEETTEQQKWKQRMQHLALLQEERSYSKLTNNLGRAIQDDVSIRSMTYAASIGLNMILAPISFGVFMYFFGGALIDFFWRRSLDAPLAASTVDNRKVICGVVSGVVMLIVEMLLFVIRTHEMDKAMRKKTRKKTVKPFGPYSSASVKTFKGE